jgi:hypothetical protein
MTRSIKLRAVNGRVRRAAGFVDHVDNANNKHTRTSETTRPELPALVAFVVSLWLLHCYCNKIDLYHQELIMSWKAGLSRYLPAMRFFACPESPSSIGIR